MTTTQHSNGPWIIDRGQIRDTDGNSLASVPYSLGGTQDYANARLIAAAPELLDACKAIIEQWEEETRQTPFALRGHPHGLTIHAESVRLREQARSAIAKAEGAE